MRDGPEPFDSPFDPRFSLPACDDPSSTEVGVVILGLPAEQLLAGLGLATLADDPAAITMAIDQVRHCGSAHIPVGHLVAVGLDRWREAQPALDAAGVRSPRRHPTSLRHAWEHAFGSLSQCKIGALGPAAAVFLTACWLRAEEVGGYHAPDESSSSDRAL